MGMQKMQIHQLATYTGDNCKIRRRDNIENLIDGSFPQVDGIKELLHIISYHHHILLKA